MHVGFLARRIYTSATSWRRNAILMVDQESGVTHIADFEGTEPPATTFVEGVILPFEPQLQAEKTLENLLVSQFPQEQTNPSHYWLLEYPGLFSGRPIPDDLTLCRVMKLC